MRIIFIGVAVPGKARGKRPKLTVLRVAGTLIAVQWSILAITGPKNITVNYLRLIFMVLE